MRRLPLPSLLFAVLVAGCPTPEVVPDAGEADAGVVDTGTIHATLQGEDGPLEGAMLRLYGLRGLARAGADGRVSLTGLGAGRFHLDALLDANGDGVAERIVAGRDVVLEPQADGRGASVDLGTLALPLAGAIEGTLRLGTTPIDATVAISGVTVVDVKDGALSLPGLAEGTYDLAIETLVEGEMKLFQRTGVVVTAGQVASLELDVSTLDALPDGTVEGLARTRGGTTAGQLRLEGNATHLAAVDENGAFRSPRVPPGIYTVLVEAEGHLAAVVSGVVISGTVELPPLFLLATGTSCAPDQSTSGLDEDRDGTPDADEPESCRCLPGTVDLDSDGLCDPVDLDVDGDSARNFVDVCARVADPLQVNTDALEDGGDACDDDDDEDGVLDTADNCPIEPNLLQTNTDALGDGGDACDSDDDEDGVVDTIDNCPFEPNLLQTNTDTLGDGGDACDADDDEDGVEDVADACPFASDTNQVNTDGADDGGDLCDADDDNDTVADELDNCPIESNSLQTNTDGTNDGGDACDPDDDNDTIPDTADNCPLTANTDQLNTDGTTDGGDACDADDDDDTVADELDNCPFEPNLLQTNTDGTGDGGDPCDPDDDDDTILDGADNCPLASNTDQLNTDGTSDGGDACDPDDDDDTVADELDNCPIEPNLLQTNTDGAGDGGDACDLDDDGDTIPDTADNCPLASNADQHNTDGTTDGGDACDADDDDDTVLDGLDNCPIEPNPLQTNTDGATDGGDACDLDDDDDTIPDTADNCPLASNTTQLNTDGTTDGGDACDADDDDDGALDTTDNCPLLANSTQANTDLASDGGDACDPDDDNDGFADGLDLCPFDNDATNADGDLDGVGDACDNCPALANTNQSDTDGNGTGDVCERPRGLCSSASCVDGPRMAGGRVYKAVGTSDTDLWLSHQSGLLQWNGTDWDLMDEIAPRGIWDITLAARGRPWIVDNDGTVHWYDGLIWRTNVTGLSLWAIWADPTSASAWAVGDAGTITRVSATGLVDETVTTTTTLVAVHGDSPTNIWAVGEKEVYRRGASGWSAVTDAPFSATDTNEYASSVYVSGSHVFIAGYAYAPVRGMFILHFDGTTWDRTAFSSGQVIDPVIRGTSPTNVWAADGEYAVVNRFDGTSWKPSNVPVYGQFWDVIPLSPTDAMAFSDSSQPTRWDGTGWQAEERFAEMFAKATAAGPNDVWASVSLSGALGHWDGNRWKYFDSGIRANWWGAWASGPSDVWMVGYSTRSPYIPLAIRWNGTTWSQVTLPVSTSSGAEGVFGSGPNDVWVLTYSEAMHWNGSAFDRTDTITTTTQLRGGFSVSATDAWVHGDRGSLYQWGGSSWAAVPSGIGTAQVSANSIRAMAAFPTGEVYLVTPGALRYRAPLGSSFDLVSFGAVAAPTQAQALWAPAPDTLTLADAGRILELSGGTWTSHVPSAGGQFYGLAGTAADLWAVGYDSARRLVGTWSPARTSDITYRELVDGWISDDGTRGWAVGLSGRALARSGGDWRRVAAPTTTSASFTDVYEIGPSAVFAVGGISTSGFVFFWNGSAFVNEPISAPAIQSIHGQSVADVWAVGNTGTILRRLNGTWASEKTGTSTTVRLASVVTLPNGDVYAAGATNTLLRWDGTTWTAETSGLAATASHTALIYREVGGTPRLIVAGSDGLAERSAGGTWSRIPIGTFNVGDACMTGDGQIWMVSNLGVVARWDGTSLTSNIYTVTSGAPTGLACTTSNGVWGFGRGSSVVRFLP